MIANYFDNTILSANDLSIGNAGVGLIENINFSDASYNFNNVIAEDLA